MPEFKLEPQRLMMIIASKEIELSLLRDQVNALSAELAKKNQEENKKDAKKKGKN